MFLSKIFLQILCSGEEIKCKVMSRSFQGPKINLRSIFCVFPCQKANHLQKNKSAPENPLSQELIRNMEPVMSFFSKIHDFKEFPSALKNVKNHAVVTSDKKASSSNN